MGFIDRMKYGVEKVDKENILQFVFQVIKQLGWMNNGYDYIH